MEQHMKIHTKSRDYKCHQCGKSFINQSRLTYHTENVHEEAKFHCDQCSKIFRSKANFERHRRIHTEEKPYTCKFCGFRCNHSTNLTSHVRTIHKEATFTTGKAAKEAKRKTLLKEMLKAKEVTTSSRSAGRLTGDQESNVEALLMPVRLGLDVLKRLECQGKIVREAETPPSHRRAGKKSTVRHPASSSREKSLIRKKRSCDQIFTVTNRQGDLVEALVSLGAMDEELSSFS